MSRRRPSRSRPRPTRPPTFGALLAAMFIGALVLTPAGAAGAAGFHDGGSAACASCHDSRSGSDAALANPSEVCLRCHAAGGDPRAPAILASSPFASGMATAAGDFVHLGEDDLNDGGDDNLPPISGHTAGHNVVAPSYGLHADPVHAVAPGGTFPAAGLACTSCHDPHGSAAFRSLYGAGRTTGAGSGSHHFDFPAPEVVGVAAGSAESRGHHNAYRRGVSAWCGNCHDAFQHGRDVHLGDASLGATVAAAYNAYRGTADCVAHPPSGGAPCGSGTAADAYLPEVPFEDPGMETWSTAGPSAASRIMCLTCHRAHASSAPDAGRWDFNVRRLEDDGLASGSLPLPNPYEASQRSLCNQCHGMDAWDGEGR